MQEKKLTEFKFKQGFSHAHTPLNTYARVYSLIQFFAAFFGQYQSVTSMSTFSAALTGSADDMVMSWAEYKSVEREGPCHVECCMGSIKGVEDANEMAAVLASWDPANTLELLDLQWGDGWLGFQRVRITTWNQWAKDALQLGREGKKFELQTGDVKMSFQLYLSEGRKDTHIKIKGGSLPKKKHAEIITELTKAGVGGISVAYAPYHEFTDGKEVGSTISLIFADSLVNLAQAYLQIQYQRTIKLPKDNYAVMPRLWDFKVALNGLTPEVVTLVVFSMGECPSSEDFSRFMGHIIGDPNVVKEAWLMFDRQSGHSRGFGFVKVPKQTEISGVVDKTFRHQWGSKPARVEIAKPKEDTSTAAAGKGGKGAGRGAKGGKGGSALVTETGAGNQGMVDQMRAQRIQMEAMSAVIAGIPEQMGGVMEAQWTQKHQPMWEDNQKEWQRQAEFRRAMARRQQRIADRVQMLAGFLGHAEKMMNSQDEEAKAMQAQHRYKTSQPTPQQMAHMPGMGPEARDRWMSEAARAAGQQVAMAGLEEERELRLAQGSSQGFQDPAGMPQQPVQYAPCPPQPPPGMPGSRKRPVGQQPNFAMPYGPGIEDMDEEGFEYQ